MENLHLTPEELAEFQAYKAEKERREAEQRRKNERATYRTLVDELIDTHFPKLQQLSRELTDNKRSLLNEFRKAIDLKSELFDVKADQQSHTFTNSRGDKRITIGMYVLDSYRDTVNEGITMVKESIVGMAKDTESRALVEAILKLLSKDQKGNLKPGRVLQLRRLAEQLGNQRLLDGVRVIEESYQPQPSKVFIRAEIRNHEGAWITVPLGMTEVE